MEREAQMLGGGFIGQPSSLAPFESTIPYPDRCIGRPASHLSLITDLSCRNHASFYRCNIFSIRR